MNKLKVPLAKPKPNIGKFLDAMSGKKIPPKVPLVEFLIDNSVMQPILENMMGRKWVQTSEKTEYMGGQMDFSKENRVIIDAWIDNLIAFWYHMGYDFVRVGVSLPLPAISVIAKDTADSNIAHNRAWQGLHEGPIKTWDDFEKYPWPKISEGNFYIQQYICDHLPEGMGLITSHAGGVYEHASRLLGYENLCMLLYDNPELVKAVADRLGELILEYNKYLLELNGLAAIFQGEDFGYNTQTLIPPDVIRKYFLPWHKKYAQMIHEKRKVYYLHSCGEISAVIEDLIEDVKIDGRHSFQDNVLPVTEAKKLFGNRICILGGVDIDKLATYNPVELRKYVRSIIEQCAEGGRFAIGAGNSITSYIPVINYLTMLDEALQ